MCVDVTIVSERVGDVSPQVMEVFGEGDKSSFHFDDSCFFALGVLFSLTGAFIFLAYFFMEDQGGVSAVSVQ